MDHICVCLCTYKRPALLLRLLRHLEQQETAGSFVVSVVVVDNDSAASAQSTISQFANGSALQVSYFVEPRRNIALARNKSVSNGVGSYVALIDDDECPSRNWLVQLYRCIRQTGADGVLGPVVPEYPLRAPSWVVKGRFYYRANPATGSVLRWTETRTGNVLLCSRLFTDLGARFDPKFASGGEDRDFFRRMIRRGCVFRWCAEAQVSESISIERCRRIYMVRRALVRGSMSLAGRDHPFALTLQSVAALAAYGPLLLMLVFLGDHIFVKYLVSCFDHLGRVAAACGIRVIREPYVM